eukprot:scaffold3443_cov52-Phaeocystis_antarctica.AAC.3
MGRAWVEPTEAVTVLPCMKWVAVLSRTCCATCAHCATELLCYCVLLCAVLPCFPSYHSKALPYRRAKVLLLLLPSYLTGGPRSHLRAAPEARQGRGAAGALVSK